MRPLSSPPRWTGSARPAFEARNPDKRLIHVIWDNAAYHKGPDVREFLARPDCRIHLINCRPIART
ncbi:hypothetical protein [Tateyamaria sp.]|uniref:hypothetical protein n=1 Tax=Tateyamaria sp. TaxID=1929288 RepID=UPI003B20EC7D